MGSPDKFIAAIQIKVAEGKETKVPRNVLFLGVTSFLNDTSNEMINPLFPSYLRDVLGVSPILSGLVMGLVESLSSLTRVVFGCVSDRAGRRKVFAVFGYTISTISKGLLTATSSWPGFLAMRVVDRLGKGVRTAPRDALIAESGGSTGRSFGFHRMMDTLGAVVGPVVGLILLRSMGGTPSLETYHTIFLISVVPASLSVVVVTLAVRDVRIGGGSRDEGKGRGKGTSRSPNMNKMRRMNGEILAFLVVSGIASLGRYSYAFTLWKVTALGYSIVAGIILYALFNMVYALLSYPIGLYSDKIGKQPVVTAGFGMGALTSILFATAGNTLTLVMAFASYGAFMAVEDTVPRAYLADLAGLRKGTLLGTYHTIRGSLLFPASLICGLLWSFISLPAAFIYGAVMNAFAMLTFLLLVR